MNRRTFLCGLTLGTLAAPLAAEGQQPGKLYRVGILTNKASDPAEVRWVCPGCFRTIGPEDTFILGMTVSPTSTVSDLRASALRSAPCCSVTAGVTPPLTAGNAPSATVDPNSGRTCCADSAVQI
jgi:hypothetical protein